MRGSTLRRDCLELGFLTLGGVIGFGLGLLSFLGLLALVSLIANLAGIWTLKVLTVPYVPQLLGLGLASTGGLLGVVIVRILRGPYPIFDVPDDNPGK